MADKQLIGINEFTLVGELRYAPQDRPMKSGENFVTFLLFQTRKLGKDSKEVTQGFNVVSFRPEVVDEIIQIDGQHVIKVIGTIGKSTWKTKDGKIRSETQLRADSIEVRDNLGKPFLVAEERSKGQKEFDKVVDNEIKQEQTLEEQVKEYERTQGKKYSIYEIAKDPYHPKYKEVVEILAKNKTTKNVPKDEEIDVDDDKLPF